LLLDGHRIEDRGSGVQQWALIAGLIAMSEAWVIGIEEPEAHLSWDTQIEVNQALLALVKSEAAPSQFFLSSHSPLSYEAGLSSIWFDVGQDASGTTVARRDDKDQLRSLFPNLPSLTPQVLRLLPSDLVRLPETAVGHLGIQRGDLLFCALEDNPRSVSLVSSQEMDQYLSAEADEEETNVDTSRY
jgi:hypothetical protein